MKSSSAAVVVALVVFGCGSKGDKAPEPKPKRTLVQRVDASLTKSTGFLLAQQGDDGAIRSTRYAAFKDGYSLTPLAMAAILFVPQDEAVKSGYTAGVDFTATIINEDGVVRTDAAGPRYPLYSIATSIIVLNARPNARHGAVRNALLIALRELQMTEDRGWKPDDASYGGWSYFDASPQRPTGEVRDPRLTANLSATLFAIGAMQLAGVPPGDPALKKALVFVERCQNFADPATAFDDGGFFFSPAIADGNKAGSAGKDPAGKERYRSYGSMTADGLRALTRLGLRADHPRVVAAAAWLTRNFSVERNPGDFRDRDEVRRHSSYYYYLWTAAHALRALGRPTLQTATGEIKWAESLAERLIKTQAADGSWTNRYSEVREDDPIVATSFATAALSVARTVIANQFRTHAARR